MTDSSKTKPTALITGAGKGIGRAIATQLSMDGYRVILHYHQTAAKALELAASLPDALALKADLTDLDAATQLVKDAKDWSGGIDLLVNNAGICMNHLVAFAKPSDFDLLLQTNLRSVFILSKCVSKVMMKQKSGSMIHISSIVAHTGNPGQSIYSCTKAAIEGFSLSLAKELAAYQIRSNTVAPGYIVTDMTDVLDENVKRKALERIPLQRFGTPEDVAGVVSFLASKKASYITGSTLHCNGGMYP